MVRLRKPVSAAALAVAAGAARRLRLRGAIAQANSRRQSEIAEVEAYGNLISLYNRTGALAGRFARQGAALRREEIFYLDWHSPE